MSNLSPVPVGSAKYLTQLGLVNQAGRGLPGVLVICLVIAAVSVGAGVARGALTAGDVTGLDVFTELDRRHNTNYQDFEVPLTMELWRRGATKPVERSLRIKQLEGDAETGHKVLVVFDKPASIRGTALLTHTHADADDDQWLYLPAFARVKKIASRNRTGSFVQSEFSFEDLVVPYIEKYTYTLVGEETLDGEPCVVVERRSKDRFSGYSKEVFWIDTKHYRVLQVHYFDRNDRHKKVLRLSDYRAYSDLLWKPHLMVMDNLVSGRSTTLRWGEFDFGRDLQADRDFSVASLRRSQ